jgi:thiamine-phosphate diphosphorylase
VTSSGRLHVIANDEVIARPGFIRDATSVVRACGESVSLHVRMKRASASVVFAATRDIVAAARGTGARVFVNDRMDVAVAAGASGVQLGVRSVPVAAARAWSTRRAPLQIGYSAHSTGEAEQAATDGADFVFLGTIWPSSSHPGECTAGLSLVVETVGRIGVPVYAIGGVTPPRAREAVMSGAHGVAVITGVWNADEPAAAACEYVKMMQGVTTEAA